MTYTAYAERVAREVRAEWQNEWNKATVAARKFTHPSGVEKTIYCMRGIRKAPFTVTDKTTCIIRDCETIEEARKQFKDVQDGFLARGYSY